MLYPILRFTTLLVTLAAYPFQSRYRFVWVIFRAWSDAYLGERWDVLSELQAESHSYVRGLGGSRVRTQGLLAAMVIGR